jgi:hypothetical protein
MTGMIPPARPRLSTAELDRMVEPLAIDRKRYPLLVIGIRGYYRDTMGKPGVNDRAIYDDAIFLVSPFATAAFNGNTDPARYKPGWGTGANKGEPSLVPGFYPAYRFDTHRGKYMALCQRVGPVTVLRDGNPPYLDTGIFGINIHAGGRLTTGSEGCQTIPPDQWPAFFELGKDQALRLWGDAWKEETVGYALLEPRKEQS